MIHLVSFAVVASLADFPWFLCSNLTWRSGQWAPSPVRCTVSGPVRQPSALELWPWYDSLHYKSTLIKIIYKPTLMTKEERQTKITSKRTDVNQGFFKPWLRDTGVQLGNTCLFVSRGPWWEPTGINRVTVSPADTSDRWTHTSRESVSSPGLRVSC